MWIGARPRRSGRAKVEMPSPPKVVPSSENSAVFCDMGRSVPSHWAHPGGAKLNPTQINWRRRGIPRSDHHSLERLVPANRLQLSRRFPLARARRTLQCSGHAGVRHFRYQFRRHQSQRHLGSLRLRPCRGRQRHDRRILPGVHHNFRRRDHYRGYRQPKPWVGWRDHHLHGPGDQLRIQRRPGHGQF